MATTTQRPWTALTSGTSKASTTSQVPHSIVQLTEEVYEVYKPLSGSFSLEVVFFPEFQTDDCEDAERRATRTWTTKDGSCWLNTWLVEHFPQARILTISYGSGIQVSESKGRPDMYVIGDNLAGSLIDLAGVGQNSPLVLVGHSFGGLVLKTVCLRASQSAARSAYGGRSRQLFLRNLRGAFFYSMSSSGSHVPVRSRTSADGEDPLLGFVYPPKQFVPEINTEFSKLRFEYKWQTYGLFAANARSTSSLSNLTEKEFSQNWSITPAYTSSIGEEGSCLFDLDQFCRVSGVDELTVCTPLNRQSSNFSLLVHFLNSILTEEEYRNSQILQHLRLPSHLLPSEGRLADVIKLLDLENPKPIVLSLVGMGGIGKSTLAKQLLLRIRNQFDFVCFLKFEDVPSRPKREDVEELAAKSLFRGRGRKVSLEDEVPWSLLREKKVLVVADAVQSEKQILPLVTFNWCGDGSRLVITTCFNMLMSGYDFREYAVPLLSELESEELFKGQIRSSLLEMVRDQEELVSEIIAECEGLPLALEMLGHQLCKSLERLGSHPRRESVVRFWEEVLARIRSGRAVDGNTRGNPVWWQMIFDELDELEKTIFLDLAVFDSYGPEREQYDLGVLISALVTRLSTHSPLVLEAIESLKDRHFLHYDCNLLKTDTVGPWPVGRIYIHPVLRNMGRLNARQLIKGNILEGAGNLWELNEEGAKSLETLSITLDPTQSSPIPWKRGSIKRFANLRLLRMSHVNLREEYDGWSLPSSLAMLHMIRCSGPPQKSWGRFLRWPVDWPIREEGVESLRKLSVLILEDCNLVRLPSNFHRLESLRVLRIQDQSMRYLPCALPPQLEDFTLIGPVERLPQSLFHMRFLRRMQLGSKAFPNWPTSWKAYPFHHLTSLVKLQLAGMSALVELPKSFRGMPSLKELSIRRCSALKKLPDRFGELQELRTLTIEYCLKLKELGESFHNLRQLEKCSISGCSALETLPESLCQLPALKELTIINCAALQYLPNRIGELTSLQFLSIRQCPALVALPESVGQLSSLEKLCILDCPGLVTLPESLRQLSSLKDLTTSLSEFTGTRSQLTVLHSSLVPCWGSNTEDVLHGPDESSSSSMSSCDKDESSFSSMNSSDKVIPTTRQAAEPFASIAEGATAGGAGGASQLQIPSLRHEVLALGLTDFEDAFTPEELVFGFSFERDLVSNYFEMFFFHPEGMGYLVGVVLPYSLVRVRPHNVCEIQEVGRESWMEFWMENSCNRYPHTLYMWNATTAVRSRPSVHWGLSTTEAAKQFGIGVEGSRYVDGRFVDGTTICQPDFSNPQRYSVMLYNSLLNLYTMQKTKPGKFCSKHSVRLATMNDGKEVKGTSGESSYQSCNSSLAVSHTGSSDNAGSSSVGGEETPNSQKEMEVLPEHERRNQADTQQSLQLTVKIFLDPESYTFESTDSSDQFRYNVEKVDNCKDTIRLVRPDSSDTRSDSCDSHDREDFAQIACPNSAASSGNNSCDSRDRKNFIRIARSDSATTSLDNYKRCNKVEYVMRKSQMVPEVTIRFLYTPSEQGPGRKELKTNLKVHYLLGASRDRRSSSEPVQQFGWFHDQLQVSFKCQNSNAVRRERRDVSEEYIGSLVPGKWDLVNAIENTMSNFRGNGHQVEGYLGYRPIGAAKYSWSTKKEVTEGKSDKIECSNSIPVNCMESYKCFAVSNIDENNSEMVYLAQNFPPLDFFDFWGPGAHIIAVARCMMSGVSMEFQGRWTIKDQESSPSNSSIETEQENAESVFCDYLFCCQRNLEQRKRISIQPPHVKSKGKIKKLFPQFRSSKGPHKTPEGNLPDEKIVIEQRLEKMFKINHSFSHMHILEFQQDCEHKWDIMSGEASPVAKILS